MIPIKEAMDIFWQWRLASIRIEVQFFSSDPKSSGAIRMHVDGLVSSVDLDGLVTVSGDAGEIELDFRAAAIKPLKDKPGRTGPLNPFDPDSSLRIEFPAGEACLIFPFRRAGGPVYVGDRRRLNDRLRQRGKWCLPGADPRPVGRFACSTPGYDNSTSAGPRLRAVDPIAGWLGVPVAPVALLVLCLVMTIAMLMPWSLPKLMDTMGYSRKMADPAAIVWTMQSNGSYYCAGSVLNGRLPGRSMTQTDALTLGYQPADGRYCGGIEERNPFVVAIDKGKLFLSRVATRARRLASQS